MTTTDTSDSLPTLPSWQVGSSLRAADLNVISDWQRWLYDAIDGWPASTLLRPAYRWDLSFSGIVQRFFGDLCLVHQHRYLIFRDWQPEDDPGGVKVLTVGGWEPVNEVSLPESAGAWVTVDLSQYDWMLVGLPYLIRNARYALESDQPYEF